MFAGEETIEETRRAEGDGKCVGSGDMRYVLTVDEQTFASLMSVCSSGERADALMLSDSRSLRERRSSFGKYGNTCVCESRHKASGFARTAYFPLAR